MFRIWYEGQTLDGETLEDWANAPETGVVAVYQALGFKGTLKLGNISSGADWYWMTKDGLTDSNGYSGDEVGVWVDVDLPEGAIAKKGKWVSLERLQEVEEEIIEMVEN